MLTYLIRRILLFFPTLLVISLITFALSKCTPGDPVETQLGDSGGQGTFVSAAAYDRQYRQSAAFLGTDKPDFYLDFSSAAYPDTLYRIIRKNYRANLKKLIAQYGNWEEISAYYHQIGDFNSTLGNVPDSLKGNEFTAIRSTARLLYLQYEDHLIRVRLDTMASNLERAPALKARIGEEFQALANAYGRVKSAATPYLLKIPDIKWYGWDNQYHHWITGFLQGDFGISYKDFRPAKDRILDHLKWTLIINGLALLIAYLLSLPLGVYAAVYEGSRFDRTTTLILFMLYSLPNFWIATLLISFFSTPEYGMDWFPSMGLGDTSAGDPFWYRFRVAAFHLILPVFCVSYRHWAFISRQMRGAMANVLQQDYIRTARAKGLSARIVVWKHAFRNSLFPIITLFASVFPAIFAGSVIIEVIFNIPGMGKLMIDSIRTQDWPVVYTILMISAVLTMLGILVADILYALADPRVSYGKRR